MRHAILDHGYIELVESWGSDERIIEAARMSTGKGFLGWGPTHTKDCAKEDTWVSDAYKLDCTCEPRPGDEKLLRYLWEHKHATPFEMTGCIIEVQAPIFVFREWHRHRTQSYNEMSARYTPLPDVNYIPTVERLMTPPSSSKQTRAVSGVLTIPRAQEFRGALIDMYRRQQELYEQALADGVPKELARVHLPVGRYSRMRASANLRNWLAFLTLREDEAAQYEIRQYANALHEILAEKFPRTMACYMETKS